MRHWSVRPVMTGPEGLFSTKRGRRPGRRLERQKNLASSLFLGIFRKNNPFFFVVRYFKELKILKHMPKDIELSFQ